MTEVYKPDEVRKLAKTSRAQISRWRREGKLVGIRIGGGSKKRHYRYTRESVHRLLNGSNGEAAR